MKTHCPPLVLLGLCLPLFVLAQQPSGIIEIRGQLMEQVDDQRRGVPGVQVYIYENGVFQSELQTEQNGHFSFKLALKNSELKLEIRPRDYRIIIPHEGLLDMPAELNATLQNAPALEVEIVEMEIVVVGPQTPVVLEKELEDLTKQIDRLKAKNQLSLHQINALGRTMLDTIAYYENQKLSYEKAIESLRQKVANEQQSNQRLQDSLLRNQQQLQHLNRQVDDLTHKLFAALEEQYLRQKTHFDDISSSLANYLIALKDLQEILPQVKQYFSNSNYAQSYNATIARYSKAFININNHHQAYLEGVERYWKPPSLSNDLRGVFDFLLVQIHREKLKPAMNEMTNFLQNRNLNKAQKIGITMLSSLSPMTNKLEKDSQKVIQQLADHL